MMLFWNVVLVCRYCELLALRRNLMALQRRWVATCMLLIAYSTRILTFYLLPLPLPTLHPLSPHPPLSPHHPTSPSLHPTSPPPPSTPTTSPLSSHHHHHSTSPPPPSLPSPPPHPVCSVHCCSRDPHRPVARTYCNITFERDSCPEHRGTQGGFT